MKTVGFLFKISVLNSSHLLKLKARHEQYLDIVSNHLGTDF